MTRNAGELSSVASAVVAVANTLGFQLRENRTVKLTQWEKSTPRIPQRTS